MAAQERAAFAAQSAKKLAGKAVESAAAAAAAGTSPEDIEDGERNTGEQGMVRRYWRAFRGMTSGLLAR